VVIAASQANFRQDPYYGSPCGNLNRESERIPRSLTSTSSAESLRGQRAYLKMAKFLTVEDSLQLAAGIFN
jgi:hypothetical protein